MLKQNSKSIFPPHHLNFFNPVSVERLLKVVGYKNINVETPGLLDVDIVSNDLSKCTNQFIKDFLPKLNENQKKYFKKL